MPHCLRRRIERGSMASAPLRNSAH
jgi:hypothetical protein